MCKIISINLKNFKCFREDEIDIGNLTILTGLNGMGKSSVIQALLLLRQSFGLSFQRSRRLKLNGDLIELGTGADVFFDLAEDDDLSLGYDFVDSRGQIMRSKFNYAYDRNSDSLKPSGSTRIFNNRLDFIWDENSNDWVPVDTHDVFQSPPIFSSRGFQYLSAERLGPRKMLPSSEEHVRNNQIGAQGEFVLGLLSRPSDGLLNEADPRLHIDGSSSSLRAQVEAWLQEVSPGTRIEIGSYSEIDAFTSRYSFERKRDVPSKPFRSTNVGFGISYVLPVLVSLLSARPGDLVIIENPEAHLHPRGQTRLGQLAAQTSAAGVQVIIETHSDHFLDGVRISAKERKCDPDDVEIHYFTRFGSEAAVISPDLQEDGRLSEWPEGFFDERDFNIARLLTPISGK
ncbi:DUF3696 domain-containing protein [Celeribacter halophilus]|uniref:DUF3696 domain-containing protein n=1 Tax=Celeribacter halophilus TaxID=576117 RepID=UPI001C0A541E|nr:DUF3696 domain-containing protein [Celeribacter halophilus]MBU2889919.1 DUF3696 domain-containing protein [Celeribacter halophilus]MDO6509257.1 DUF3696 domain-containing protein [Celeribacter halophilus]